MNQNIKIISFSSPKGGVGRTMTLANCARIYSNGASWAGIEEAITFLIDLDFHAPGIHYYDFQNRSNFQEQVDALSWENTINNALSKSDIGLVFLLSKIIEEPTYKKKCALVAEGIKKGKEQALFDFQDFVSTMLKKEEYNPSKHVIHNSSAPIYILPAGSPNNPNYNATVFKFEWYKFMNTYLGLYLLDCIFYNIVQAKTSFIDSHKPVRILLDQQAGSSVAAAINRSLADAHILVGGFNKQNQSGLKSLVDDFRETYIIPENRYPWIVLNQYDGRKIALDYSMSESKESPHHKFSIYDKENREAYKTNISRYKSKESKEVVFDEKLFKRIYVTEFDKDAIQKEHFYETNKLSFYELTKLLVSIETHFNSKENTTHKRENAQRPAKEKIVFIGERVKINDTYSGPLNGMYSMLTRHFSDNIIALAAKHEDIYRLSKEKKIKVFINAEKFTSITDLHPSIFDVSTEKNDIQGSQITEFELSLNNLDFIAYPYHCITHLKDELLSFSTKDFFKAEHASEAEDTIDKISLQYCEENIIRWKEYCLAPDSETILGIPLFVNFQLLAYRNDYFTGIDDFQLTYRKEKHRDFNGFQNPGDLLDFVELTTGEDNNRNSNKSQETQNKYLDVYLSGNPENIAKWYEWQAIFSTFYCRKDELKENKSLDEYESFLLDEYSVDAFKNYFKLFLDSKKTENNKYTWDILLEKFYSQKNGASLILIWPDAIPNDVDSSNKIRTSTDFIYQAPPSFHIFEECWMFSALKKESQNEIKEKFKFLNSFLSPDVQKTYTEKGGLPTHKAVLSNLDLWQRFAFLAPLWSVYFNKDMNKLLIKRESFNGIYEAGLMMGNLINLMAKLANRHEEKGNEEICSEELNEKLKSKISKRFEKIKKELYGK